jgi:hypothetical protein
MINWVTILRTLGPELANIVSAAAPAFTARKGMVDQQITELQQAVVGHSSAIKEVADKGQQIAKAVEELVVANQAISAAQQEILTSLRRAQFLAIAALAIAIIAIITGLAAVALR